MQLLKLSVILFCISCSIFLVKCQNNTDDDSDNDDTVLRDDWSYCFEFTWFGPAYDNFTRYNKTCEDYIDDGRSNEVPCSPPIVISYDGTPPDIDYLWKHYKNNVLCRRSATQVCARYTYKYNNAVTNATYMCTKVIEMGDGGAITSGCYTQNVRGYDMEVCVCKSDPGIYKPCNGATLTMFQRWFILIILFIFIF